MFSRIQWRIAAGYIALITLVLVGLGVYLVDFFRAQQLNRLELELERQARLVAHAVEQQLANDGAGSLDMLAKQLGRESGARITLIAPNGLVLGDSDHDPSTMDNHASRPEVMQALQAGSGQSQRRSATLEQDMLYVAVPVERQGSLLGVARTALPVREIAAASNQLVAAIASALAVAAALATTLAILLARITARPVRRLTDAARRLAAGQLQAAIPVDGRDEVSVLARAFNEMAAKLQGHIRAVEDERGRLAAVLANMADGLIMLDDGQVRLVNTAAARLLQTTAAQAEGQSAMAVLRDHELASLTDEVMRGAATTSGPQLVELGPTAQRRTVQAMAARIPRADGSGERVLLMLQDVTELRRAETVRREFVSNVSHELRTPVASLKALVETLEGGALDERDVAREFLGRMQVEVDGLAQLVEELLELSQIEAGRLPLHLQSVDLGSVAAAAAGRLRPQAERQGVSLHVKPPVVLPAVEADPERIHQVVINLVHNAVKFTPPGGQVTVSGSQYDGGVAITVADTGMGIAPEVLPRLFERFYKADQARAGGGTGLGLAIAKHLVQAHGGRIWAESAGEGQGATFTFTLPISHAR